MNVFVGLSGGVDSAVAAALLKERGYDVTGVFIKIWQPEFIECTWREDRLEAMRVAAHLGIPFREVDLSPEYKREVADAMIADYARGITPNPDVTCNRAIKFGHFFRWVRTVGAEYVATGHYARIAAADQKFGFRKSNLDLRNPNILLRGRDRNKDQSYFLYQLTQEQLAHTLFPIGDLTKQEVRARARSLGLPNAKRPDSQGICFLGDVSMEEFLARFIPLSRGAVLHSLGHEIGEHHGAALYTIGQRHGFSLHAAGGKEHYVVSIDASANTITVSPRREDAERAEVILEQMNWIIEPSFPLEAEAEARYREKPVSARALEKDSTIHVSFAKPHVVAPGQSLVFYDEDTCLGGGVIRRTAN